MFVTKVRWRGGVDHQFIWEFLEGAPDPDLSVASVDAQVVTVDSQPGRIEEDAGSLQDGRLTDVVLPDQGGELPHRHDRVSLVATEVVQLNGGKSHRVIVTSSRRGSMCEPFTQSG